MFFKLHVPHHSWKSSSWWSVEIEKYHSIMAIFLSVPLHFECFFIQQCIVLFMNISSDSYCMNKVEVLAQFNTQMSNYNTYIIKHCALHYLIFLSCNFIHVTMSLAIPQTVFHSGWYIKTLVIKGMGLSDWLQSDWLHWHVIDNNVTGIIAVVSTYYLLCIPVIFFKRKWA